MKRNFILFCGFVLILAFSGCNRDKAVKDGVIRVNDEWIKKGEIDEMAVLLRDEVIKAFPERSMGSGVDDFKKQSAEQAVANLLLVEEAKRRGIKCENEETEKQINEYIAQMGGESRLGMVLEKMGQTREEFVNSLREKLIVDSLIKVMIGDDFSVSEQECRQFYENNRERFTTGSKMAASQIVLLSGSDTTEQAKKERLEQAETILKKIENGEDFSELAKKYSQGPNAKEGGNIGWFSKGDLLKDLEVPLSNMKKGEVSGVIETKIGVHILKKTDEKGSEQRSFSDVKWKIENFLLEKKKSESLQKEVKKLMANADITFADTAYSF